jgi:DNA processing protein
VGGRAVSRDDPFYPAALRSLTHAPSVVYVTGPWNVEFPSVALVGARDASDDGVDVARGLASALSRRGVAVLSGLARGIDAAAHRGALEAGGWTGAVLGTGLDRCYPSEHRDLQRQVAASLGLLTEHPPGAPATAGTFASRNRLLAALADAVVVIQGRERSGALLTAGAARRLGKPVGAVPWDSRDPLGASPHALIRSRAAVLVRGVEDVLELLGMAEAAATPASLLSKPPSSPPVPLGGPEERLFRALRDRPRPLEAAARDAALTIAEASAALVLLEIGGRARRDPGGEVRRVRRV